MYILLGGTGHITSAITDVLSNKKEQVSVITHNPEKVSDIESKGAGAIVADVNNREDLQKALKKVKRLFILNPPADPGTDTATEELKSVKSIVAALEGLQPEKIVAESTYGAQPGDNIGDLSVLYNMEQGLTHSGKDVSIIRAAYYMSNWDFSLETAKAEGKIYTLYPVDFKLPMVAPKDIAQFAAHLLISPPEKTKIYHICGPEEYSANDVAEAFAKALGKTVEAVQIPEQEWESFLQKAGFSEKAAHSMANMTRITLHKDYIVTDAPHKGTTTIATYIINLIANS